MKDKVYKSRLVIPLVLALAATLTATAENWPQWRGPAFNGSSTETNLPTQFSKTNGIAWATPLPGPSSATPVVWEDSVFVSSPDEQKNLLLFCLERKTGQVRWQKTVGAGDRTKGLNNMASPSPVTDGQSVFILFGTGDLAAFDFAGHPLWKRNLAAEYGHFADMWLYGSSPLLYKGKLYILVLQRSPVPPEYTHAVDDKPERESFLLCLDPKTGKNLWRQVRPTDAPEESQEAYTTPIPHDGPHGPEILIVGGDYTTAHSPDTGAELWRCGGINPRKDPHFRTVPSPVAADGMVITCGPRRAPLFGIKDGGKGLVTDTHLAWSLKEVSSDCVTPLYYQQRLFVLDGDHQQLFCLEPQTGKKVWEGNLGVRDIFRASPTGADGKIYCISEKGTVVVLDAGSEFKILSTGSLGGSPVRSSIAVSHGQLFIRTGQHLYCVAAKTAAAK